MSGRLERSDGSIDMRSQRRERSQSNLMGIRE